MILFSFSWWLQWKSCKDVVYSNPGASHRSWGSEELEIDVWWRLSTWTTSLEEGVVTSMLALLRSCLRWSLHGGDIRRKSVFKNEESEGRAQKAWWVLLHFSFLCICHFVPLILITAFFCKTWLVSCMTFKILSRFF